MQAAQQRRKAEQIQVSQDPRIRSAEIPTKPAAHLPQRLLERHRYQPAEILPQLEAITLRLAVHLPPRQTQAQQDRQRTVLEETALKQAQHPPPELLAPGILAQMKTAEHRQMSEDHRLTSAEHLQLLETLPQPAPARLPAVLRLQLAATRVAAITAAAGGHGHGTTDGGCSGTKSPDNTPRRNGSTGHSGGFLLSLVPTFVVLSCSVRTEPSRTIDRHPLKTGVYFLYL